ncbi:hypothetical protein BT63DRAFT_261779 [Microthyrium microscopicum]|uniref:Uncharacterized protein n=1 Tax=Microthyrium microscopicum TaxID=703497 RepID=A0A6A6UDL1_9PEZI|nr:hypothetical protein BT63DRAFT_261779 [Microthyrium microscopicum]
MTKSLKTCVSPDYIMAQAHHHGPVFTEIVKGFLGPKVHTITLDLSGKSDAHIFQTYHNQWVQDMGDIAVKEEKSLRELKIIFSPLEDQAIGLHFHPTFQVNAAQNLWNLLYPWDLMAKLVERWRNQILVLWTEPTIPRDRFNLMREWTSD